ncbi:bifunctional diguanylate cyclase/phosphodiesterase [Roseateles cavernae]|uniref:bifunctional diguanylate cyclase/phosphodiesterase n=1 Tax=Roseateles cavernae TaxID=3153578 RepID=UPI0032E3BDB0
MQFPLPAQELERLKDLQALGLLDSARDPAFDDLVSLAAEWCEVPIAAISLVDANRQWFKARCGLDAGETPRDQSFCTHAILKPDELMQVRDALLDPRFADNPLVTGELGIRFYAGAPLLSTKGYALGALCVIDRKPRELTASQQRALIILARQVGMLIELRRKRSQLEQQESFLLTVIESLHEGVVISDSSRRLTLANQSASEILGLPLHKDIGKVPTPDPSSWRDMEGRPLRPEDMPAERTLRGGEVLSKVYTRLRRRDGSDRVLEHNTRPLKRNGGIDGVVVSFSDVTDKLTALQQLRDSEARLRGITDNVPALIAYVDGAQRVRFCNRVALEWGQRSAEQVLDHPLESMMGATEYASHREHVLAALAGQRREFGFWSAVPGEPRFLQFSYVPDCCDKGNVQGFFVLASDLTAMKNLEIQLAAEARFDALTGLPNRRHFHEQLDQGLLRAQRHGTRLALGFLDLDGFKLINDQHGHAIGDAVLKEFGRRLRASVRQTDFVARLAGDEFTVLLEDVQQAHELAPLARKILAAIRAPFELAGGLQLPVRTSLGLALAGSGERAAALVERADAAMYRAKSQGRDDYVIVG